MEDPEQIARRIREAGGSVPGRGGVVLEAPAQRSTRVVRTTVLHTSSWDFEVPDPAAVLVVVVFQSPLGPGAAEQYHVWYSEEAFERFLEQGRAILDRKRAAAAAGNEAG